MHVNFSREEALAALAALHYYLLRWPDEDNRPAMESAQLAVTLAMAHEEQCPHGDNCPLRRQK
jgi:hypothetical protein